MRFVLEKRGERRRVEEEMAVEWKKESEGEGGGWGEEKKGGGGSRRQKGTGGVQEGGIKQTLQLVQIKKLSGSRTRLTLF